MKYELPIEIRQPQSIHYNFILNSWASSQTTDQVLRSTKRNNYKPNQPLLYSANYALAYMLLHMSKCLTAIDPNDPTQLYGYVVYTNSHLLWIYTKKEFRNTQVANRLLSCAFNTFKDKELPVTSITYALSHQKENWKIKLDFNYLRDVLTKIELGGIK